MADSSVSRPEPSSSVLKRRTPYEDAELVGLFELFDRLPPGDERATLSSIARDRLRARFPRGEDQTGIAELVSGLNIEVDLGDLFGAEFYVGHCNETAVVSALCRTLPQGARVIDVGANFGLYALNLARYSGKLSRAVAFEPAPRTFGLLEANIKRNRLSTRIKARRAAVSETPGVVTFHVATDQSFSGLRDTGRSPLREAVDVEQVSLDTDPAVAALGAIDFLKIDTEGGEAGVLAGASNTIARSPGLVVLMEHSVKNLTAQQAAAVRKGVDKLLAKGLRGWTIDLSDKATPLKSAAQLPATFNGSLLLAAPKALWVEAFIAALGEASAHAAAETGLAWSAAAGLLRILRQGQQDITTLERWSANAGLPEGAALGERVIKHIERLQADTKSLSARLERAEATAKSDHERDLLRQESERLKLKQEEVTWYSARLEQQRRETDALRALAEQKDLEITALNEKIVSLRSFMNRLSDQLHVKSEDVIRLMERRESDAAARGDIEIQWAKSLDAMRARVESLSSEVSRTRAESDKIEEKRAALRGHVDDLNAKLAQAAAQRTADAAEHLKQLAEREAVLSQARASQADLQAALADLRSELAEARAARAADLASFERRIADSNEGLKAAEKKRIEMRGIIDELNAKLAQAASMRASAAEQHTRDLAEREQAWALLDRQRLEALGLVAELKAKLSGLEQGLVAAENKRVAMRAVIDDLNGKVEHATLKARDHDETVAALRDALASANARVDEVSKKMAASDAARQALEAQMSEATTVLNERREQVRQLQQELALKKLGRKF